MIERSVRTTPSEGSLLLISSSNGATATLGDRPAAPGSLACSERLPRDLLVRLAALSRQVGDLRREHAASVELSLHLEDVAIGLDSVIRSIHDQTVEHLSARRA